MVDTTPDDIAREQVRRELDSSESTVDAFGQRLGNKCLADSRDVLEKDMLPSEQCDQRFSDYFLLAEYYRFNVLLQAL